LLTKKEKGYTKKDNIDKLDEYLITLRNSYGCIPIVVSQFNRDMADTNRQRFKELTPLIEDFKDSGNTQESANVIIAVFHPKRYNMDSYKDYLLKSNRYNILDMFRMIFILKNRGGRDGVSLALRFLGICGYFEEIPKAEEFNENVLWYEKVKDFSKPFLELIKEKNKK
jgi:replicative DNA helicase